MEIYLLRHGIAEDGRPGTPDSDRKLTTLGIDKLRSVLRAAKRGGVDISLILTSPYVRARQTAEIAGQELGCKTLLDVNSLVPHGSPEAVWNEIRVHRGESAILLVSHEPLVGNLTRYMLSSPALQVDVKKSALIRIDFDSVGPVPKGILKWILIPKLAETA